MKSVQKSDLNVNEFQTAINNKFKSRKENWRFEPDVGKFEDYPHLASRNKNTLKIINS